MEELKSELLNDPLMFGYSSMDSVAIEVSINAFTRDVPRKVPVAEIATIIETSPGCLRRLRTASSNTQLVEAIQDSADTLVRLCEGRSPWAVIDMTDAHTFSTVNAMLSGLSTNNILSQTEIDALLALGITKASRAQELGLGYVTSGDVNIARQP